MIVQIQKEIFDIIKNPSNNFKSQYFSDTKSVQTAVEIYKKQTGLKFTEETFESSIVGSTIPNWINPIRFEHNLNQALDSLEAAENLLFQKREQHLLKVQKNFIDMSVRKEFYDDEGTPLDEFKGEVEKHVKWSSEIKYEEFDINLDLRLAKKVIDLIHYTRAARVGSRMLFNEKIDDDLFKELNGVNRIREILRILLNRYRKIANTEQDIIVPVSLKHAKVSETEYLVEKWNEKNERTNIAGLEENSLVFDLKSFSKISNFERPRLKGIGLQLFDSHSMTTPPTINSENARHLNQWQIELVDEEKGMSLDKSSSSDKYIIDKIFVKHLAATSYQQSITWAKSKQIINFNPKRKWRLNIDSKSTISNDRNLIRDIIVYFHFSFNL